MIPEFAREAKEAKLEWGIGFVESLELRKANGCAEASLCAH